MLNYAGIIKKLMGDEYHIPSGHEIAPHLFRETIDKIKKKVPDLRGRRDWDIEGTVVSAIEWAIRDHCKLVGSYKYDKYGDHASVELYVCSHPEIGEYSIIKHTEFIWGRAYSAYVFELIRDRERALERFEEETKWIREELKITPIPEEY